MLKKDLEIKVISDKSSNQSEMTTLMFMLL